MNLFMRFLGPLGIFGLLIYWAICLTLFIAPIAVLGIPFWAECLVVFALFLPLVGIFLRPVLYVVAIFFLGDVPVRAAVVFWVSFAVYFVTEFVPSVIHAIVCFREVRA